MFFYVYYKYICIKKSCRRAVSNGDKLPVNQEVKKTGHRSGKASNKRDR